MMRGQGTSHKFEPRKIESNRFDLSLRKNQMLAEYEKHTGKGGTKRHLSRIPLWYFLHELLELTHYQNLVAWEDNANLVFTIKSTKEIAALWGRIKNKDNMTYPKLARGIRYYYGKGVIEKHHGKRFTYKFIVSDKTRSVLMKHGLKFGESSNQANIAANKRKSTEEVTKINDKRRRYKSSSDSFDSFSSTTEHSSDEEDTFISPNDVKHFECYLSQLFSETMKFPDQDNMLAISDMAPIENGFNSDGTVLPSYFQSVNQDSYSSYTSDDASWYNRQQDSSSPIDDLIQCALNENDSTDCLPPMSTLQELQALLDIPVENMPFRNIKEEPCNKLDMIRDMEEQSKLPDISSFKANPNDFSADIDCSYSYNTIDPFLLGF